MYLYILLLNSICILGYPYLRQSYNSNGKAFFFLNNDNVYTLTQFIYVYIIWERDRWCQYNQEMLLMVHEAITMKIVINASRHRVS